MLKDYDIELTGVRGPGHNGTVFQVTEDGEPTVSSMFNAVGQVCDSTYMKLGIGSPPSSITGARVRW